MKDKVSLLQIKVVIGKKIRLDLSDINVNIISQKLPTFIKGKSKSKILQIPTKYIKKKQFS